MSTDERLLLEVGQQQLATSILGRIKDHLMLGILAAAAVRGRCFVNELSLMVNSVCFQITDVLFSAQQQHPAGHSSSKTCTDFIGNSNHSHCVQQY